MRWLSILEFASAGSFVVFYVYISGLVEPEGRGVFHCPDFDRIRNKTYSIKRHLYAEDTKFSNLPLALNCFKAESNIQINVSLASVIFKRKNFKHKELFLNKTHDLF